MEKQCLAILLQLIRSLIICQDSVNISSKVGWLANWEMPLSLNIVLTATEFELAFPISFFHVISISLISEKYSYCK
jgi:hypothetical protein